MKQEDDSYAKRIEIAHYAMIDAVIEFANAVKMEHLHDSREQIRDETGKCSGRKSYAERAPEVIAKIKVMRRKRKGRKRTSYKKIAEQLNAQGIKTVTGKSFTGNLVAGLVYTSEKIAKREYKARERSGS